MGTFTLRADFRELDNDPSPLTKSVTIRANATVVGPNGVIYDDSFSHPVNEGVVQVELPANDIAPGVVYTIRRPTGTPQTFRVAAQNPGTVHLLSSGMATIPPPDDDPGQTYVYSVTANGETQTGHVELELGAGGVSDYNDLTNVPTSFAPAAHNQAASTITGLAPVATSGTYADLTGKPTEFPPAAHTSALVTDFTEAAQDAVAAMLAQGTGVVLNYNDAGNTLTITSTATGGVTDPEVVRDTIGTAMVGVGLVSVVVNDAADTITITTTATQNDTDANLRARSSHTGSQDASTVDETTDRKWLSAAERTKVAAAALATDLTAEVNRATGVEATKADLVGGKLKSDQAPDLTATVQALVDAAFVAKTQGLRTLPIVRGYIVNRRTGAGAYTSPMRILNFDPDRRRAIIQNVGTAPVQVVYKNADNTDVNTPSTAEWAAGVTIPVGQEDVSIGTTYTAFCRPVTSGDSCIVGTYSEAVSY